MGQGGGGGSIARGEMRYDRGGGRRAEGERTRGEREELGTGPVGGVKYNKGYGLRVVGWGGMGWDGMGGVKGGKKGKERKERGSGRGGCIVCFFLSL